MAQQTTHFFGLQVPFSLIEFVKDHMNSFKCGAHDWSHVERVCGLAMCIARAESHNQEIDLSVVLASALCHDVLDSKLVAKEHVGDVERQLLEQLRGADTNGSSSKTFLSEAQAQMALFIVKNIGYRRLLSPSWEVSAQSIELRCVQDADLLDAIGCVGVARCFAFGGKAARPLLSLGSDVIGRAELTQEAYAASTGSGLEHFFEKLLRIPAMLTTAEGRVLGRGRGQRMREFVRGVLVEAEETTAGLEGGGSGGYLEVLRGNLAAFEE